MIAHLLRRETADTGWRWLGLVDGLFVRAWVQPWPRAGGETGYGYDVALNNVSGWRSDLGGFDTLADAPQAELELGARLAAGVQR